jgi:DNA-binding helix-hairpin-helix protein with protein kinase domain
MTKQKLMDFLEYLGRKVKSGTKITVWQCPKCEKHNLTVQPTEDLVTTKGYWDSVKQCVHCPACSFVLVWPDGEVKVNPL